MPSKKPSRTGDDETSELGRLIAEVRQCADSAEHVMNDASSDDAAREREVQRLRHMLVSWELKRASTLVEAQMLFTEGIEFYATVTRALDKGTSVDSTSRHRALEYRATLLVQKIQALMPGGGADLDVPKVMHAIDRRAAGRFDWDAVLHAWGHPELDVGTWRTEWKRWRPKREP